MNRLTTLLRIFVVIPIAIVFGAVDGGSSWQTYRGGAGTGVYWGLGAGGMLVAGPALMILFRQKYPRWWV